jgi:four helix bundle protein
VSETRVERFEDLVAWQLARVLNREIHAATRTTRMATDRELVSQMRRSSRSVTTSIAGGFERGGRAEFAQFLSVAEASEGEVRSLLCAALDAGYLDERQFMQLREQADRVGRIVGALRAAVARQRDDRK